MTARTGDRHKGARGRYAPVNGLNRHKVASAAT